MKTSFLMHRKFVGRDEIDHMVFGLSRLLQHCFRLAKERGESTQIP